MIHSKEQASLRFAQAIPKGETHYVTSSGTTFGTKKACQDYCDKKGLELFEVEGRAVVVEKEVPAITKKKKGNSKKDSK